MRPKHEDEMVNSIGPDQTAPSDLGLQCLLRPVCPYTSIFVVKGNLHSKRMYNSREKIFAAAII